MILKIQTSNGNLFLDTLDKIETAECSKDEALALEYPVQFIDEGTQVKLFKIYKNNEIVWIIAVVDSPVYLLNNEGTVIEQLN